MLHDRIGTCTYKERLEFQNFIDKKVLVVGLTLVIVMYMQIPHDIITRPSFFTENQTNNKNFN